MAELEFNAAEWRTLTASERVRRCLSLAEQARLRGAAAAPSAKEAYVQLSEQWLALAQEVASTDIGHVHRRGEPRGLAGKAGAPAEGVRRLPINLILRSLPEDELARLLGASTLVPLQQHQILYQPGEPVDHVYFLDSGMVSMLTAGADGRAIETGVIGREGLLGSTALLGSEKAAGRALVQIGGTAHQVPRSQFLDLLEQSPVLTTLVQHHIQFLLFQAQQNAFCHALHSIEARLCRWLLQACDILGGDALEMTQEACAHILGVQRTSVSMVAHTLQEAGSIRTIRGKIDIVNRAHLEQGACECYRRFKQYPAAADSLAASLRPKFSTSGPSPVASSATSRRNGSTAPSGPLRS
jgi:CRP-like cAMP-binding protein